MANPGRARRDIDRAKRERAARKRERRQQPRDEVTGADEEASVDGTETAVTPSLSEHEVLGALDDLHRRFAAEEIGFDEFEAERDALLAQLASGS